MKKLQENIIKEWNNKKGPVVFTTVGKNGVPNAIYASCVSLFDRRTILIADNYFDKTKRNILSGGMASVLFITEEDKSYQIKGTLSYHKSGPFFDDMKEWNPPEHPGRGAVSIEVDEVYSGSEKIL
ncbi:MAG: pyridoxamine 5'-phosphate oxidase family protein [Actinomycetota bacterium]|nr:pyridoxamine 5'-phosphate oxidase family protein [Actinomycetota bacterium]